MFDITCPIVIDLQNYLRDYKNKIKSLIEYNTYLLENSGIINTTAAISREVYYSSPQFKMLNKYLEESVRQIIDCLTEFPIDFLTKISSKPNLFLIFGSLSSEFQPTIKIELEAAWKELALGTYFNIVKQAGISSNVYQYILIRILDDGILMAAEMLYGYN